MQTIRMVFSLLVPLCKWTVSVFLIRCILVYSYRLLLHPLHKYPGPFVAKFTDLYGVYHAAKLQLHLTTYSDHQRYGSVIRQGPNKLVFASAKAMHGIPILPTEYLNWLMFIDILQNDRLPKSRAYLVTQASPTVFNLFNVIDKRQHRTKRRIIGQGLNERAMRRFEPVMAEHIETFLDQLGKASDTNEKLNMTQRCCWLGLDISGEIGFGHSFELQTNEKNRWMPGGISTSNRRLNVYLQSPVLKDIGWERLFLPIILPKVMRFHYMVRDMIRARLKEDTHSRPDLLSAIHDFKDPETGSIMSRRELWSESTFLIPAAGDTTASLLAASFFYLSRYPKTYDRLAKEIRESFSRAEDITNGPKLAACQFLRAFIEATLRISPPSNTTLWRDVPADAGNTPVIVDGDVIPTGTQIGVNVYCMHRNPIYFTKPNVHSPERWIREEANLTDEQWELQLEAFMPFSLGARNCAGKAVVYLEVPLVLARTLWHFDFQRADTTAEPQHPEFEMWDQIGSRHDGPLLHFYRRNVPL